MGLQRDVTRTQRLTMHASEYQGHTQSLCTDFIDTSSQLEVSPMKFNYSKSIFSHEWAWPFAEIKPDGEAESGPHICPITLQA